MSVSPCLYLLLTSWLSEFGATATSKAIVSKRRAYANVLQITEKCTMLLRVVLCDAPILLPYNSNLIEEADSSVWSGHVGMLIAVVGLGHLTHNILPAIS